MQNRHDKVSLLDTPFPYRSMLAICSDLDETDTADIYFNTMDYLNTTENTPFGTGVGLETGNSMYFYMPQDQFAYWNSGDSERARVRDLMQSGHIDCFHSFGDLATKRSEVESTLQHLDSHNCSMRSWIDHAVAPSNFGGDIMQGFGDVRSSEIYHADLTTSFGVEYVWIGRVSSMRGQDAPVSLAGIWSASSPTRSLKTVAKEAVKVAAGKLGNKKYSFHANNRLIRDTWLRDGQKVREFMRSNPHVEGVSVGDTSEGLGQALSEDFLDRLIDRRGKVIIYTHLGKKIDADTGFAPGTRAALEELRNRVQGGDVLVSTTTRILDFATLLEGLAWSVRTVDGVREICVDTPSGSTDCQGLSFEIESDQPCALVVNGERKETERFRGASEGRDVVGVPWRRLDYPR